MIRRDLDDVDPFDVEDDDSREFEAIPFVLVVCPCGDGSQRVEWHDGKRSDPEPVNHGPGPGPTRCVECDECVGFAFKLVAGYCEACYVANDLGAAAACKVCGKSVKRLNLWEGCCAPCVREILGDEDE